MYYMGISTLSFLLTLIYLYRWNKHFDDHMTVIFVLIPLVELAYVLMYLTRDRDAALLALKIVYLGGCFLPWMITMCEASLCHIRVGRPVRILTYFLSAVMYGFVLTIGHSPIFYTSFSVETLGSAVVMEKGYGPMHTVHYIVILLYLLADLGLILYSYREKKQVSRRILALLFIPIPVTMLGYALNRVTIGRGYEIVPLAYVLAQLVYLFIVQRMVVYNVSDIVVEALVESGDTGFITVDFKKRYLGSNGTAREILPDLNELTVDGTGYPDGLKGEEIPLEARIMAVADVYDALVSKRVYKEKFSFSKADAIIREGMGTQFDARLRPYYEKARPRLEVFYSSEP